MPSGTIKKLIAERGFGFVTSDDGKDSFFHRSGVDSAFGFDGLRIGQPVSFSIEASPKGPRAVHVRPAP